MPPSSVASHRPCPWISSNGKLGLTLAVMIGSSLIPLEHWPALGLLLVLVLVGLIVAEVTTAYVVRRLVIFLPMLLVLGLSVPLTQAETFTGTGHAAAWNWTIGLWLRCGIAFLAGLWLIHVLPFSDLLATLLKWRCPALFVAMLAFMYRYIFILWDELARLRHARDCRDFGGASLWVRWQGKAEMIGLLLLRAMERAERIHHAMLARGWNGSIRFLGDERRASK